MSDKDSKVVQSKPPNAGRGRKAGTPNKTTALLKDALLKAAENAGNGDMVAYLTAQALANPAPFMALLGKVLPLQIAGDQANPIAVSLIELRAVYPKADADH